MSVMLSLTDMIAVIIFAIMTAYITYFFLTVLYQAYVLWWTVWQLRDYNGALTKATNEAGTLTEITTRAGALTKTEAEARVLTATKGRAVTLSDTKVEAGALTETTYGYGALTESKAVPGDLNLI